MAIGSRSTADHAQGPDRHGLLCLQRAAHVRDRARARAAATTPNVMRNWPRRSGARSSTASSRRTVWCSATRRRPTSWRCTSICCRPSARPAAVAALVRDIEQRHMHLSTGFVGTPYLPHVLTQAGRLDLAYQLLLQNDVAVVALRGDARRDDDLGALGRLDARQRLPGPRHELVQPLRLRRDRRVAVRGRRRD